jgi:hypothetical protein
MTPDAARQKACPWKVNGSLWCIESLCMAWIDNTSPIDKVVQGYCALIGPDGPQSLRKCAQCDGIFEYKRDTARYCSATCRVKASQKRLKKPEPKE